MTTIRSAAAVFALLVLVPGLTTGIVAPGGASTEAESASPEITGAFTVDMAHSTVLYRIRHFGVANFYGRVNMPTGTFLINPSEVEKSSMHVRIEIRNMDAGNRERDRFILSPDFFNVREHPTAEFRAKSFRRVDDATIEMTGDFTMRGVTKQVVAQISEYTERTTAKFGHRAGFEARFTVSRSDFGMDKMLDEDLLGDQVTIIASIEGVRG